MFKEQSNNGKIAFQDCRVKCRCTLVKWNIKIEATSDNAFRFNKAVFTNST